MCCAGRKVSCSHPLGPEPLRSTMRRCIVQHEDRHHPDVQCVDCFSVHQATFTDRKSQRDGECAAYKVEMTCLEQAGPQCGGDATCLYNVVATIVRKSQFANMFFNCGLLP